MTTTPDPAPRPPVKPAPLAIVSVVSLLTAGGLGGLQLLWPGKASSIPSIFGTVSSWISAGGIMGILSLLIWLQLGNRKIGVEEAIASHADEADLRDHWADELAAMRKERADERAANATALAEIEGRYRSNVAEVESHYQNALQTAEDRHAECERQREDLRTELVGLREEIKGMRAQIRSQATDRVLALGQPGSAPPSDDVTAAAHRVKKIGRRGKPRGADKAGDS